MQVCVSIMCEHPVVLHMSVGICVNTLISLVQGLKNVVKRTVCAAERVSITAQCKINFTLWLHEKKLHLVNVLHKYYPPFGVAYLQEYM